MKTKGFTTIFNGTPYRLRDIIKHDKVCNKLVTLKGLTFVIHGFTISISDIEQ